MESAFVISAQELRQLLCATEKSVPSSAFCTLQERVIRAMALHNCPQSRRIFQRQPWGGTAFDLVSINYRMNFPKPVALMLPFANDIHLRALTDRLLEA
jgi:hypothetical protein